MLRSHGEKKEDNEWMKNIKPSSLYNHDRLQKHHFDASSDWSIIPAIVNLYLVLAEQGSPAVSVS